jgi:predicted negative regulator of RcsB-dependent stress response
MSDEFDSSEINYSSFWPLLILLVGFILWLTFQDYELNNQRSAYSKQFQAALPTITEARNIGDRYVALMKDLVQTSAKDQYAAQIVKDAIQAGLIHVNPPTGTNSTSTPTEPTK